MHSVSVIIPVYNFVALLDKAVQSVLSQDYSDIEMVVVNDGSHAEASARIADICATDKRISLLNQDNQGPAHARRKGLTHARGDFIIFLDGDDYLLPGAITHLMSALDANPHAIAAYGRRIETRDLTFEPLIAVFPKRAKMLWGNSVPRLLSGFAVAPTDEQALSGDILPCLLSGVSLLFSGSVCIRRQAIEQVVFPENIRFGEDWVTWCRLALLGNIIYAGRQVVVCKHIHTESLTYRALTKPEPFFDNIQCVYESKDFIAHIGKEKLAEYRLRHVCMTYNGLWVTYAYIKPRRLWKAFLYKMLATLNEAKFRYRTGSSYNARNITG